ncbi:MAG TPA: hypothetical protein VIE65_09230 [Methylobacter sp.]|jgi:hypothetical protein
MFRLWPLAPAFVVAAGAVLVAIGGFWQHCDSPHSTQSSGRRTKKLRGFSKKMRVLSQAVIVFAGWGFKSWVLTVSLLMLIALIIVPAFIQNGKYSLYDVSARIVDIDELKKNLMRASKTINIGNMTPGFAVSTATRLSHHGKDFNFNIFYVARNGSWTQMLRMRWVEGGWAVRRQII